MVALDATVLRISSLFLFLFWVAMQAMWKDGGDHDKMVKWQEMRRCLFPRLPVFESGKHERKVSIGVGVTAVSPSQDLFRVSSMVLGFRLQAHHATTRTKRRTAHIKHIMPTFHSFLAHLSIFLLILEYTFYSSAHHIHSRPDRSRSLKLPADAILERDGQHPKERIFLTRLLSRI